jgi:hypothetical protein
VKFIRKAQTIIEATRVGVLGYITNHGYLDNPTFRGMRQSLMSTFSRLRVLNLHGNANKKEQAPDGSEDKNVFDIRQGVAICLATRDHAKPLVEHADFWGSRESKYVWLANHQAGNTAFTPLTPDSPFYFFGPQNTDCRAEYNAGWKVTDIFPMHGVGVVMARDSMTVDFDADVVWQRVREFASLPTEKARSRYDLGEDARDWRVSTAQADVRASGPSKKRICSILYRPFDRRFTYYTGNSRGFYASPFRKVMSNMVGVPNNLGLALSRSVEIGQFEHVFCTREIVGHHSVSLKEVNYLYPLWLIPTNDVGIGFLKEDAERRPNLAEPFLRTLASALSVNRKNGQGLPGGLTPEDIFHYAYAVFHSPCYRTRYAEFLKNDFPRLPLTDKLDLFCMLAGLGRELAALHLLESSKLGSAISEFVGSQKAKVEKISWSGDTVWIDRARTTGFRGVREAVWSFRIGGYQVCEKWLKDRRGRTLTKDDIVHYHKIVVALAETIRLMKEIDETISAHGGWPDAFSHSAEEGIAAAPAMQGADKVVVLRSGLTTGEPTFKSYETASILRAAEPEPAEYDAGAIQTRSAGPPEQSADGQDLICLVRQTFSDGVERERKSAIDELACLLGYQRIGSRIDEELDNTIRTAVRRGILESANGMLKLAVASIEHYDRAHLKDQFLASLAGYRWIDRDDAIRTFARWMGFRRTGSSIDEIARSLINGLIREGRIERDGGMIRRSG